MKLPELPVLVSDWEKWSEENEINNKNVLEWIKYLDRKLEQEEMPIRDYCSQANEAHETLEPYFKNHVQTNYILVRLRKMSNGNGLKIGIGDKNILIDPSGHIEEIKKGRKKKLLIKQFKDEYFKQVEEYHN